MIYAMKLVKKDESFNLSSNTERTLDVCALIEVVNRDE